MRLREATLPYLLPPTDAVEAGPWMQSSGLPLPERLPDWDPATELHLWRSVTIDVERIFSVCQIEAGSRLRLLSHVRSDRTGLRIVGEPKLIDRALEGPTTTELHVQGHALGGTVRLATTLVLAEGVGAGPLAPSRPGSELWAAEQRCALEGGAARFPISAVPFSTIATLDPGAAWSLDWDPDLLEDPVLGGVRLLINTEHQRVRDAVITGSSEPGADVIRATIHFDVARTLITGALSRQDFVEGADRFAEGSVGRAVVDLIRLHWDESPESLAARARDFPRRFEMELQHHFPPVPSEA